MFGQRRRRAFQKQARSTRLGRNLLEYELLEDRRLLANLFPTAARIVDGNNNVIVPQPGERFWVRVEYTYDNPTTDFYSIGRVVNANPEHTAPAINWGAGNGGRTTWNHVWGAWVLSEAGTYQVTVSLDNTGAVAETDELDNSISVNFSVGGSEVPEWELVGASQGRTLLGDGTDVIVGTMDDALDYHHPWLVAERDYGRRPQCHTRSSLGSTRSWAHA